MKCIRCQEEKELTQFVKDKHKPSGYRTVCRSCHSSYRRQYKKTAPRIEKVLTNARDTVVVELTARETRPFLEQNHKQGFCAAKVYLGLVIEGEILMIMSFGTPRFTKNYEWEIVRLCSKGELIIRGGASKLMAYFVEKYNPLSIISYSFEGIHEGTVYEHLGFVYKGTSKPGYSYEKDKISVDRTKCQKHKLSKLLGKQFNPSKTELQNMVDAGYRKVLKPRNKVYVWQSVRSQE